ncbi:MAG: NADPH:quinone oxidoreductase family protein [Aquabacterium sp.]|jgi:NADPH2:quinone reductase|uniref:NADPH:quinone oxidoreductase family protein n=1 Tax=Aquabacterium sp. TaxID=1872578 RepID=UPI001B5E907F|nr:NADPH:quinone oxidoreductase family protein [Aquabacterium sp.]MBP7132170.1 NADPH:quinone oxidoreductase family protein [Aquabacterium sp.]MBP9062606.1 NADPH:quinone oxidoreductase family protein [Aquabacterium sp.]MDQ5925802.1 NADPH:quinone reductase [Pseudomonadota bacterium]
MQAWICNELNGPDALVWQESPTPEPGPGEVRVAIKAASLNFPDLLIVQGKYQMKPPLPFVPGAEFAGVVEAVGEGVKHLSVGSHVAGFGGTGGFGTHTISKAAVLMPLPPAFSFEDGAAFLCTYGTTYHGLMDRGTLKAGETVLVLGAAGGVGTAAIQIAKAAGAKVIAAASTDEKCTLCKELGADATINYSTQNLRDELKTLTEGKGPDVIYDPVGGDVTEQAFRSIAWRGRLLVVGFANGGIPALPLNLALLKGASILGVFWGEFARREPQNNAACLMQLAAWYMEGKIKPVIEHKLPMSQLKEAFALMGTRQVRGKVVLVND